MSDEGRRLVTRRDVLWAAATALVTLALFVVTLRPDVGGTEDSPKFQFVGRVLGTSHSPGYPFYSMATYAFGQLPIGTLAYRINLFSAVCGALSCLCIFLTARRLGVTRPLSFAAALAAATSYPVWSNSVTAEVYTLAAVLSGMAIYWLIAFAQAGATWRLYAACAMWAMGFGNHLTIVGILPAAVVYGIYRDRSVLRPRVAITAALIGILGVVQYWFIAIRTLQGAPYLEARATTIMGVFDVIIARDVSWARFYQAQSAVAAIELPMLLNGIRVNMGTVPIILVMLAIGIALANWKKHTDILLIFGAAAGTLGDDRQPLGRRGRLHHPGLRAALAAGRIRPAGPGRQGSGEPLGAAGRRCDRDGRAGHQRDQQPAADRAAAGLPAKGPASARCTRSCRPARRSSRKTTGWRASSTTCTSPAKCSPTRIRACSTTTLPRCGWRWLRVSRSTPSRARRTG